MGRGRSKAGGTPTKSGGGVTQLNINGDHIDLSDSPLIYGSKDKGLSSEERRSIEAFESKRYRSKIEYATVVDEDGVVLEETRGGKGSVRSSWQAMRNGTAFSHIHPRENGILGGTFSDADIANWSKFGDMHTYRAATKEGVYSITKRGDFDWGNMAHEYRMFCSSVRTSNYAPLNKLNSDYKKGKIDYSEYSKKWDSLQPKCSNKMLVEMHNWLLKNQDYFGYDYVLERR